MSTPNCFVGQVRPSQLLWTYGPGALIDLPNLSVITMGLDYWKRERCTPIKEARLLNCPFCGGQIFVRPYIYKNEPSIKPKYVARCENPKCTCYVQSKIYNTIKI